MKGTEPMTSAERARLHRERKKSEGCRLIQAQLNPRSATIVGNMEQSGMTVSEAINNLIDIAYQRTEQ